MPKSLNVHHVEPDASAFCSRKSRSKLPGRSRFALATLGCFLFALPSPADPARDPKRLVNNFTVDLTPLCRWWQHRDGPRPLPAWTHITGSVVGTNPGAWIIEGKVDESKSTRGGSEDRSAASSVSEQARFLLLNPPVDQLLEFQRLTDRLVQLNRRRADLVSQAAEAHSRHEAVSGQERAARRNRAHARVLAVEDKQLKNLENQAKTDQKSVEQEIKDLQARLAAYPKVNQYVLDCFALDRHSELQQMPVYDYGLSWK